MFLSRPSESQVASRANSGTRVEFLNFLDMNVLPAELLDRLPPEIMAEVLADLFIETALWRTIGGEPMQIRDPREVFMDGLGRSKSLSVILHVFKEGLKPKAATFSVMPLVVNVSEGIKLGVILMTYNTGFGHFVHEARLLPYPGLDADIIEKVGLLCFDAGFYAYIEPETQENEVILGGQQLVALKERGEELYKQYKEHMIIQGEAKVLKFGTYEEVKGILDRQRSDATVYGNIDRTIAQELKSRDVEQKLYSPAFCYRAMFYLTWCALLGDYETTKIQSEPWHFLPFETKPASELHALLKHKGFLEFAKDQYRNIDWEYFELLEALQEKDVPDLRELATRLLKIHEDVVFSGGPMRFFIHPDFLICAAKELQNIGKDTRYHSIASYLRSLYPLRQFLEGSEAADIVELISAISYNLCLRALIQDYRLKRLSSPDMKELNLVIPFLEKAPADHEWCNHARELLIRYRDIYYRYERDLSNRVNYALLIGHENEAVNLIKHGIHNPSASARFGGIFSKVDPRVVAQMWNSNKLLIVKFLSTHHHSDLSLKEMLTSQTKKQLKEALDKNEGFRCRVFRYFALHRITVREARNLADQDFIDYVRDLAGASPAELLARTGLTLEQPQRRMLARNIVKITGLFLPPQNSRENEAEGEEEETSTPRSDLDLN